MAGEGGRPRQSPDSQTWSLSESGPLSPARKVVFRRLAPPRLSIQIFKEKVPSCRGGMGVWQRKELLLPLVNMSAGGSTSLSLKWGYSPPSHWVVVWIN